MQKQKRQLVFMLILLVLVLASFLVFREWNRREEGAHTGETVNLMPYEVSAIDAIEVYDGAQGENLRYRLQRTGTGWEMEADGVRAQAKADTVGEMADVVAGLSGTQPIGNVSDFAQYGLSKPAMTIVVSVAGNQTKAVLSIGDLSTAASMYYAYAPDAGGEDTVYLITTLVKSLYDVPAASLSADAAE